ncbi:MAG TPA: hypothetical protein VGL78_08760 [Solirubrobacteraceae bacterium]
MEGILKYLRLRTATLAAALVVTAAVLGAMSAPANAVCFLGFCPKDVSFQVINESRVPLFVQICPRGHSKNPGSTRDNPCRVITYSNVIGANGERQTFGPFDSLGLIISPSYPLGVCEKAPCPSGLAPALNRKLYVYVQNPLIGKPFFRVQGIEVALSERQEVEGLVPDHIYVVLQRFADSELNGNPVKVMKIVIRRWPA